MSDGASFQCSGERVTLVEIILDGCENTFGQAPCTATGVECYNTWNTCKDKCNFSCTTNSYWFSTCNAPPHLVPNYTANIINVESSATSLELGRSFSTRGRIKITFQDAAHNDSGFDPYWPRGAIPIVCAEDMPGTLFGRWIERVKYFENRRANVYHGFADRPLCDFVKESYFIDSVSGPDGNCRVSFTLKDPLILADDKNAQCPSSETKVVATQVVGNEFRKSFTLGAQLDGKDDGDEPFSEVGNFLLQNNYFLGDPVQDACFTRLRYICIGNEVLEVKAEVNNATPRGWNIRLIDRAACGSELSEHSAGSTISFAETFENSHVGDVVLRLLLECSEIQEIAIACCEDDPISLINFDSFKDFQCQSPLSLISQTIICKPVGLTTLLNELSDQFLFFLYFNSETGKIDIRSLSPPNCDIEVLTIDECEMTGFTKKTVGKHFNQVQYNIETIDCSKSVSAENLSDSIVTLNADSLLVPCLRREFKTRSVKTINSRWINRNNQFVAQANSERWLMLRNCPASQVSFKLPIDRGKCFSLGGYAKIHHPKLQDVDGGYLDDLWLLKGKSVQDNDMCMTFERTEFDGTTAPCFNCDTECPTNVISVDKCELDNCVGVW